MTDPERVENTPCPQFARAKGKSFKEMREHFEKSELYKRGDAFLAWVNEGDLLQSEMQLLALREENAQLRAEVERLRDVVEAAYYEGVFDYGDLTSLHVRDSVRKRFKSTDSARWRDSPEAWKEDQTNG